MKPQTETIAPLDAAPTASDHVKDKSSSDAPEVLDPNHKRKRGWNGSLEGLRGFSAALVLVTHTYNMAVKAGFIDPFSSPVMQEVMAKFGPFGVTLFFMISGYLIVQSLIKHGNAREFLKNRIVRIYPVFLILHLIIFTLGPIAKYDWMGALRHNPAEWLKHFVTNLLFLPGVFPLPRAQRNAWSLSFEALFYILASLAFVAVTLRAKNGAKSTISGVAFTAGSLAFLFFYPSAFFFVAGALAYYFVVKGGPHRMTWLGGAVGLVALAIAFFTWNDIRPSMEGWAAFRIIDLVRPSLAWVAGLLTFLTVVSEKGWFSAFLRQPPITFLGKVSYSLYLIHPFVLDACRRVLMKLNLPGPISMVLFAVVGLSLAVYVSSLSYRYIEVAVGKWLARRLQPSHA